MATPASSAREIFRTTKSGKICEAVALAFIVTLGSGLRFWHLGARSLWVDEGATAVIARLDWWNFLRLLWRPEAWDTAKPGCAHCQQLLECWRFPQFIF